MKKFLLLVLSSAAMLALAGCGSGSKSKSPRPSVTHFAIAITSEHAIDGTPFGFTVTAVDDSNSVVHSYVGTIHFSSSDRQALMPGNLALTNGTGTFLATLKTVGTETINVTDVDTPLIKGASPLIKVDPGMATRFSVYGQSTVAAGVVFSLMVDALDSTGYVATGYTGKVHFRSSDAQATLPEDSVLAKGSGVFSVTLKTVASETITATDVVTPSIAGSSSSINVTAASPRVVHRYLPGGRTLDDHLAK